MPWNRSPSGMKANPLPPRPVFRREVGRDIVIGAEIGFDRGQQLLLGRFRLFERLAGERVLIEQDFPAGDFVDPGFVTCSARRVSAISMALRPVLK